MSAPFHSNSGAGKPSANKSSISLPFVLNAARHWWKVAAPVGLVIGAVAAGIVYWRFVPAYEARYRLQINQDYIVFPKEQQPSLDFIRTQGELIRSQLVLGPVIAEPEIMMVPEIADAGDPSSQLMEKVAVKPVGGAQLFDVTYVAANPNHAALVVNRVVESYFELRNNQDEKRTREVLAVLNNAKLFWEGEVTKAENKLRSLAVGAADVSGFGSKEVTVGQDPTTQIQVELVLLEADVEQLDVLKKNLEEPLDDDAVPAYLVEQTVEQNPQIHELNARLFKLQADVREMESKGKSPAYAGYKQQVSNTQAQLELLREDLRKQVRKDYANQLYFKQSDELEQLEQKRAGFQAKIDHLSKQLVAGKAESDADIRKVQGDAVEIEFARTERDRAVEIRNLIVDRMMRIETEKPMSPVLSLIPATPPTVPVEELPYRNLTLAALGGLLFPFGVAVLWELRARRVCDGQQFQEHANLEIIGEIATFPTRSLSTRFRTRSFERGVRMFEESVDSLSTYLVLAEPIRNVRVLAVSSAESREGKTSVASKLALSVAQATNSVVLLIDGDMRSPDVHKVFGVGLEPGLVDVLSGKSNLDEAILKENGSNVHLLTAGSLRGNPHKLLGSGALKSLMEEVRNRYRYVILDTPPILPASEALLLASSADAAIMCVMRDRSNLDRVTRANARLSGAGVRVLGAVLNGVPANYYARTYGEYSYER
jgi:capsular exopolysaccharide synthesis family protein